MNETIRKQLYKWMISRFNPEEFEPYPPSEEELMKYTSADRYSQKTTELYLDEILNRIALIEHRLDEKDKTKK